MATRPDLRATAKTRVEGIIVNYIDPELDRIAIGQRSKGFEHGYDTLILTLAYCGLRWRELFGLRVRDIDFSKRRLTIQQTVVADKGYRRVDARATTPSSTAAERRRGFEITHSEMAGSIRPPSKSGSPASHLTNHDTPRRASPSRRVQT